jgi:hypothetical protein
MICPTGEAKYFLLAHWTGFSTARPSGKSPLHPRPTRGPYSLISPGAKSAAPHLGRNAGMGEGPRSADSVAKVCLHHSTQFFQAAGAAIE